MNPLARCLALLALLVSGTVEADPALVSGAVVDPTGDPLPGVRVVSAPGGMAAGTVTGAEGRFRLEAPAGTKLRFAKEGFVARELDAAAEMEVRLVRAAELSVRVLDAEGRPVAGAAVEVLQDGSEAPVDATSGAEGLARFENLVPGRHTARIEAEGFREAEIRGITLQPGGSTRRAVRLQGSRFVSGLVLDPEGEPVPDARLTFLEKRASAGRWWMAWGPENVGPGPWGDADERGRFRLEIPAEDYGWSFWDGPYLLAVAPDRAPALLALPGRSEEDVSGLEVSLASPGEIRGIVTDPGGKPFEGAELEVKVRIRFPDPRPGRMEQTGPSLSLRELHEAAARQPVAFRSSEKGRFRVTGVPPGRAWVAPERPPAAKKAEEDSMLELAPGDVRDGVEIVVRPGRTLAGRVQDAKGNPVEGALVSSLLREGRREAKTGAEGLFHLENLRREEIDLHVEAEGFASRSLKKVPVAEPVTIRLEEAGSMEGAVYDASTGQPVAAFSVEAEPLEKDGELRGRKAEESFSDPQGRYLLTPLTAGIYSLTVDGEGYLHAELQPLEVRVAETTPVPPVHLDPGLAIEGIVRGAETSAPLEGALLRINPVDLTKRGVDRKGYAPTDERGRFRVGGLEPGSYFLEASHPDFASDHRVVELKEGGDLPLVHFSLGVGGRVEVVALQENGEPWPGSSIKVIPDDLPGSASDRYGVRGTHSQRVNVEGRAVFERLRPGPYTFLWQRQNHEQEEALVVEEGGLHRIVFEPDGVVLHGTVTRNGVPVQKMRISVGLVIGPRSNRPVRDISIEGNRYETPPLAPGRYRVLAAVPREGASDGGLELHRRQEIELAEENGRRRLDIDLQEHRVRGRVLTEKTGTGVEGARVWMREVGGPGSFQSRSGPDGSFEIPLGTFGRFEIEAFVPDSDHPLHEWRAEPRPVTVAEGTDVDGLVLELAPPAEATLEVSVLDAMGQPVPGASVQFVEGRELPKIASGDHWRDLLSSPYYGERTDREGRARLEGEPAVDGLLIVLHQDHAPAWISSVRPTLEGASREIVLERGGALEIVVPTGGADERELRLTGGTLPVPLVVDSKDLRNQRINHLQVTATDSWLLSPFPAGTWTVEASAGGRTRREIVTVREGERAVVDWSEGAADGP